MRQVLFHIPLNWFNNNWPDVPIYGYGFMLFLTFIAVTWLAARLGRKNGLRPEHIQDLGLWIFLTGIIGARITFMIQYYRQYPNPLVQFFYIWDGGLVFYGSLIGGFIGFVIYHRWVLRKYVSLARLADIVAPCIALGLCLGRIGCLLNGCCYGHVADESWRALSFPMASPPRVEMTRRGYQTAAGFAMDRNAADKRTVGWVEPGSPAEEAGLRAGDVIVQAEGRTIKSYDEVEVKGTDFQLREDALLHLFLASWPRGQETLQLNVDRPNPNGRGSSLVRLPSFAPWTIGLHPTQLYETISAALLLFLLLSYLPFQRRDGELIALLLIGYSIHRFINESLRTDTDPVFQGLTLSQNISILTLVVGVAIALRVWVIPSLPTTPASTTPPDQPAPPAPVPPPEQALQG